MLSRDGQRVATVRDGRLETFHLGGASAGSVASSTAPAALPPTESSPSVNADPTTVNTVAEPAGAFTDDGRWFIARARDGQFDVFDMATGARIPFRLPPETTSQGQCCVGASACTESGYAAAACCGVR